MQCVLETRVVTLAFMHTSHVSLCKHHNTSDMDPASLHMGFIASTNQFWHSQMQPQDVMQYTAKFQPNTQQNALNKHTSTAEYTARYTAIRQANNMSDGAVWRYKWETDRRGAGGGVCRWVLLLTGGHALPELAKRGKPIHRGWLHGSCVRVCIHDLLCSGG